MKFLPTGDLCIMQTSLYTIAAKSCFWKKDRFKNKAVSLHLKLIDFWFSDSDQPYIFKTCWKDSGRILITHRNLFPAHIIDRDDFLKHLTVWIKTEFNLNIIFCTFLTKNLFSKWITLFWTIFNTSFWGRTILKTSFWGSSGAKAPHWTELQFGQTVTTVESRGSGGMYDDRKENYTHIGVSKGEQLPGTTSVMWHTICTQKVPSFGYLFIYFALWNIWTVMDYEKI